jgi:beta-glucosidase
MNRRVRVLLSCLLLAAGCFAGSAPPARATPAHAVTGAAGTAPAGTLTDDEVRALVSRMTDAEKIAMVNGTTDPDCTPVRLPTCFGQVWNSPGVPRLGIPRLRITDGPAGIRLSHFETAMPAPVGLAATFDRGAAARFGSTVGKDGRASNQDVWLAPMINQVVVPTGGRNFETLGEDPFLAARLVSEQTRAAQAEGLIVTLKHYAENDFENGRTSTSVGVDERTLREGELQAFEAGVDAGAGSVMCSFNRVNDVFGCSHDELLDQILKGAFGFEGFVMTDFGAAHATSDLHFGLDMEQPGNNRFSAANLTNALTNGTPAVPLGNDFPAVPAFSAEQWRAALDGAVVRILEAENAVGLLEGTEFGSRFTGTPAPFDPPRPDLDALRPASFAAAETIAEESATLLRNERGTLPLRPSDVVGDGVLVMGPTAVAAYVGGGGSAHVTPAPGVVSPYDALKATLGPSARLRFVPGYDLDGELVPSSAVAVPAGPSVLPGGLPPGDEGFAGQAGWLRQQTSTATVPSGAEPAPCGGACAPDQVDPTVDYGGANALPAATAWRWTTRFTAPSGGPWQLKVFVRDQAGAALFVDGLATNPNRRINVGGFGLVGGFGASTVPTWDGLAQVNKNHDTSGQQLQQATFTTTFAAGETHDLDLRAVANGTDPLGVRFQWVPPGWDTRTIDEAAAAARSARKVVIFAYDEGTEGNDRPDAANQNNQALGLTLPGYQDALISAVAAANPDTVVVLNTGDPVLMPWARSVRSILEMWYPGQRGGVATADVLTGRVNPGGKLPVTFPPDATHFPTYDPGCTDPSLNGNCPLYPGRAEPGFVSGNHGYRTIDYASNGIFVGYRWYDLHDVAPLFPFGHGLSYTSFRYADLTTTATADGLDASFTVRNVGPRPGAEVAQVYVGPTASPPVPLAERALVGFERVELAPGHAKRVTAHVAARGLSYWSTTTHRWELALGARALLVGSSSRDIRLSAANATAPALTVPPGVSADARGRHGAVVTYETSAVGVAGTAATVACSRPSGTLFPVGITRVACTATDGAGNATRRGFHVLVRR